MLTPAQARAAVIAFGLLSLILVIAAANECAARDVEADRAASPGSGIRGGLILFGVSALSVGGLWVAAPAMGWGRDRLLWVGVGGFLALMTLLRPASPGGAVTSW